MAAFDSDRQADFSRILSHQMKAPIHAIQSLLRAVSDTHDKEVPPSVREAIARALDRSVEAGRLVEDLLEYERYEHGASQDEREFEIIDLLQELVFRFAMSAAAKDVSIATSFPEDRAVYVRGSRAGVEHALRNLLDNAVKYTPPLGRVSVEMQAQPTTHRLRIAIADSGGGIPQSEIQDLFKPFFRSKTRVASTAGTGLGLAIAHRIVESHHGSIEVSSREGIGTTFAIDLPYTSAEQTGGKRARRRRVVIIGGVTSGPKAAARLRRLDEELDITIVERNEFLSYAGCQLPYFISNTMGSSDDIRSNAYHLTRTAHFFDALKNITILNLTRAERINRETKTITVRRMNDGKVFEVGYDTLLLATGSLPSIPQIPGTDEELVLPLHSLEDAKHIRNRLHELSAQDVVIVGGGLIGISTIQAFLEVGARVTVVEREASILSAYFDSDFSHKIEEKLKHKGVKIATSTEITAIVHAAGGGVTIQATNRSFNADLVVLSSGLRPNVDLAEECGLALGPKGGIAVDESLHTSDPNIFAVGDCAETAHLLTGQNEYWPLGSVSVKMGRTAADVIAGKQATFHGSLGTVLLSCCDLRVARTGLTSEKARTSGFDPVSFVLAGVDRFCHTAAAEILFLKVTADRGSRRLLGAQALGRGEIAPKISLFAAAIASSMTTDALFGLDLGHHPEFNLPIDIVQTACLMLNNKLDGLLETISLEELERERGDITLVAVTEPEDGAQFLIPGSLEISLGNLRRLSLPFREDEAVVLYSKNSREAYEAYRYLVQRGYEKLRVLEGGFLFRS